LEIGTPNRDEYVGVKSDEKCRHPLSSSDMLAVLARVGIFTLPQTSVALFLTCSGARIAALSNMLEPDDQDMNSGVPE